MENELGGRIQNADTERRACLEELRSARVSLEEKERALELLGAPRTLLIQLAAQGDVPYRASALWNQEQARAILLSSSLQPQEGKDYELWLIRGDKKIPAGLLEVAGGQPTIAQIDPALLREGRPDALAVTIEPAGGMPQPTGPIVLLGKLA
jgi:anti-sigma-K factor RskA